MAVDDERLAEIHERLAPLGDVASKKMFGGVGFWEGGDMFAVMDSASRLYFKTDAATSRRYLDAGSGPFAPQMKGREPMAMPYHEVPADVEADDDLFEAWARDAIAVGHATSKKKK